MNNFHNAKIIATMGPAIDKETILAKIVNQIDIFSINFAHGDEDIRKKYIDMIIKLDSSKSIMLDIRGPEIKTRNQEETTFKKGQEITIRYAEFFKKEANTLFVDYPNLENIDPGALILLDNDTIRLEVTHNDNGVLAAQVIKGGFLLINRSVEFENYIPQFPFLNEKDKRHIIRGSENNAHMIAISCVKTPQDIESMRLFLKEIHASHLKLITKIETISALENIHEIIKTSDGIIIDKSKLMLLMQNKEEVNTVKQNIIELCNTYGTPVIMVSGLYHYDKNTKKDASHMIQEEKKLGIDAFMLTRETAVSENPIDTIMDLYDYINEKERSIQNIYTLQDLVKHEEKCITDYIIFSAYRASRELPIKAIICPTESGYTPARLSALKPKVPIISFTKNDNAYRYMNVLRGVKGYKISSTFEYTNIKQIGKEIIRILFKGNISLDDKILIVHSSLKQNVSGMINGIELYKFKDI